MKHNLLSSTDIAYIKKTQTGVEVIYVDEPAHLAHKKLSLQTAYDVPVSMYFLDTQGHIKGLNSACVEMNRFVSDSDAIDRTAKDIFTKDSYLAFKHQDTQVLTTGRNLCQEHLAVYSDGLNKSIFEYKFPWFNQKRQIMGIFGMALELPQSSKTSSLELGLNFLMESLLGFNNFAHQSVAINNVVLTKRERECAVFLIEGMSARKIAQILGLSIRTIEHYIENLKAKFQVSSKLQLIDCLRLSDW